MNYQNNPIAYGSYPLSSPVALAPMVGLSHTAFRSVLRQIGGVGLYYTEMLAVKRLPHDSVTMSPLLVRGEDETFLVHQLVGGDLQYFGAAIEKLHKIGADGIDLNLGCPASFQRKQGAGQALSDNRELLGSILKLIKQKSDVPLSAKIRLGATPDSEKLVDFCRFLVDSGVEFLVIHARLHGEKFCRKPRWAEVAPVSRALGIPVLINGGIFTVADARRALELSGADGVMLGRGVVVNPWLGAEISEELFGIECDTELDKKMCYFTFLELVEQRFTSEKRLGRIKQFTRYYAKLFTFGHHLASKIQNCSSVNEARDVAELFFSAVE